ncbi:hypothetical protein [Streptomyces sp. NPDC057002]|uniref:hypothetical protein n=1 Tax=Streptomyces sp. NPDC057002 TaxID=3345992 RepID=UPI00363F940E
MGSVLIAVAGVAGTLGGALLTQRGAEKAKRRELEMTQTIQEAVRIVTCDAAATRNSTATPASSAQRSAVICTSYETAFARCGAARHLVSDRRREGSDAA